MPQRGGAAAGWGGDGGVAASSFDGSGGVARGGRGVVSDRDAAGRVGTDQGWNGTGWSTKEKDWVDDDSANHGWLSQTENATRNAWGGGSVARVGNSEKTAYDGWGGGSAGRNGWPGHTRMESAKKGALQDEWSVDPKVDYVKEWENFRQYYHARLESGSMAMTSRQKNGKIVNDGRVHATTDRIIF